MLKTCRHLPMALALMATTLMTAPALAETLTVTDIKGGAEGEVAISVPRLEAVDSSLDEAAIRAIFAKGVAANADALAELDAASITIPELRLTMPKREGKEGIGDLVYTDIVISEVTDGVARSVTVGGASSDLKDDGKMTVGAMAAEDFNIAALLRFYGLTPAPADAPLETVYRNFSFDGAKMASKEFACTFGAMTAEEFRARPMSVSFGDIVELADSMEGSDSKPTPEQIGKVMRYYAEMLTAFESSPMHFGGLDCSGKTDKGENLTLVIGPMDIDGFSAGVLPAVSVDGVKIDVEGDGFMTFASIVSKKVDFAHVMEALKAAPEAVTDAWFEANYRKLIPAFEGFSFSGLDMDVPDEDKPGTRIKAQVGEFDLTMGNYVNGIPTAISNAISGIVVPLPADSEEAKPLRDLGFTEVKADYSANLYWDEATRTVVVDHIALSGNDLGSIVLLGTVGNVAAELFGTDLKTAVVSAMGVTLKSVQVDLHDAGAAKILIESAAKEQGQTEEAFRQAASGMAQGTILALLGSTDASKAVADAVGAFISGDNPGLSISVRAKAENGLTIADFMAAQDDPTTLIKKVDVSASSLGDGEDEAAEEPEAEQPEEAAPDASAKGSDKARDKTN